MKPGVKHSVRPGRAAGVSASLQWRAAVILVSVTGVFGGVLPVAHPHESQAVYWAMAVAGATLFAVPVLAPDRVRAALAAARAGWYLGIGIMVAGVAGLVLWGSGPVLWLAVAGWVLVVAATSEEAAIMANSAVAGLCVADVMTRDPDFVAGWCTAEHFLVHIAGQSGQRAFPVLGTDGGLAGVAVSRLVARVPRADRRVLHIGQVALAVPPAYLAAAEDPARSLFIRPFLAGEVAAVVLEEGRVTGIVTAADIGDAARRARRRGSSGTWLENQADARNIAGR